MSGRGLLGPARGTTAGTALALGDVRGRSELRTTEATLAAAQHRLAGARAELARAQDRLAQAEARHHDLARSFATTSAALAAAQGTLTKDDAGSFSEGVDLSVLDTCLGDVEQALNQVAVGQTAGGLASLRASSSSCAALNGTG